MAQTEQDQQLSCPIDQASRVGASLVSHMYALFVPFCQPAIAEGASQYKRNSMMAPFFFPLLSVSQLSELSNKTMHENDYDCRGIWGCVTFK